MKHRQWMDRNRCGCLWRSWLALMCLGVATTVSAQMARVNLAKWQPVQASSATAADPAVYATDGIVGNGNRWKSSGTPPHSLVVTLPMALELGSAHLYLGRDDLEAVASFSLQYWNGSAWVNIPGATVSGNTSTLLNLVFASPVTASQVRFYSTESVVRVREFALFPANGPAGYPLGTDVTVNLAKKRPVTASSVESLNYAKGAVDGYADDGARWKSANANGPHTLDIDLQISSRVGSAHLYTGSSTGPPITNFSFQAWSGSAWTNILGGAVTGNTNSVRRILFTSPADTSKVRMLIPDNGGQRVRELLLFAANGTDGFPLGTDVIVGPPPATKFDTYGDGFWRIVNVANPHSLIVDGIGASQTTTNTTEEEKQFQLLYNLESDSFRLRNRDTYSCLGAKGAGQTNGTAVAEVPDYQAMPWERWRFQDVGSGNVRIVNAGNGLALETDARSPATVSLQTPSSSTRQYWHLDYATHYPKKGTGGYEGDWAKFGTSWAYNWGRDTGASLPPQVTFVPMQHNRWWPDWATLPQSYPPWHTTSRAQYILGFNEPDHTDQANMTVADALALWPKLEQSEVPLVSPVPANAFGGWLGDFYNQADAHGFRVDFTAVHRYANPDAGGLISHLQSVYDTWGRAVWLTEFSCVDWGGTATWSEEDNYRFLAEFLWRAEDLVWLKRYAIFVFSGTPSTNPWERNGHRSDVFNSDGTTFTPFGELYAAWDGDRTIHDRTAYLLHNKSADHRLRSSSLTNTPSTGDIRRSDVSAQWALVPAATADRWHIVSLRDGRRLRWDGVALDLAPPGTAGSATEWTYTHEADGYFFLDHPATSKRLRLNRVDDANGAPTSITYVMEVSSTVRDSVRWRFVKPYQPVSVAPPGAPASLTALAGVSRVTLTWTATTATDFLHYTVYRGTTAGGPYAEAASGLTTSSFVDTNVVYPNTYRYVVTVTDWIENESAYSPEASAQPTPQPGTYDYWAATALADQPDAATDFEADPDGDGLKNGMEYAFLTDPLTASPSPLTASRDSVGPILVSYPRNRSATDLQFDLVAKVNLSAPVWVAVTAQIVSQVPEGLVDRVTVRPNGTSGSVHFYRLRVRRVP